MNKVAVAGKLSRGLRLTFTCGLLAVLALVLAPAMVTHAAIIQVTNTNDSGAGSLRQAIADAGSGDEITFADTVTGTITLTSGELSINKNLIITGPGAHVLRISGNNASRVFNISHGTEVTISGLTIANADVPFAGGGILNEGTLNLNNSTVSGNKAGLGGGIYNNFGTLNLTNSTVSGNHAVDNEGGGIYSEYGTVTITSSTVSDNESDISNGGGIYSIIGTVTLNDSTLSGNYAEKGGGIYNGEDMVLVINKSIVSGNYAWFGAGVYNDGSVVTLDNSTVSGNEGWSTGAGIYSDGGTVTLNNSTVSNNLAGESGGIFSNGLLKVKNTIIAGNNAQSSPDCGGTLTSYGCNLIEDTSGCTVTGDETGNIYGKDPLLGTLQDNGGPTFTHALLKGSPAIDAVCTDCGCTTIDGQQVTTDQRGKPRPADGDGDGTALCDIGAYELQPLPSLNSPPIADAGSDQRVYVRHPRVVAKVTLDGSGSYDPDGDSLTYEWSWDGTTAQGVNPTMKLPLEVTTITLVVNDGELDSEPDTVDITVLPIPEVPPKPAKFSASYLYISPPQVFPNQQVEVSINIANHGGERGSHTVVLYINGNLEQSQTVGVSPDSTKNLVFRVAEASPGTYDVSLEGQQGQFTVVAPHTTKMTYFPGGLDTGGIVVIAVTMIVLILAIVLVFSRTKAM